MSDYFEYTFSYLSNDSTKLYNMPSVLVDAETSTCFFFPLVREKEKSNPTVESSFCINPKVVVSCH